MITVAGHRVIDQGGAHGMVGCPKTVCVVFGNARLTGDARMDGGHCRCECGESSPHLDSNRERQAWHRQHKIALVEADKPPETSGALW